MQSNARSYVSTLTDATVAAAADGTPGEKARVLGVVAPQVRLMVLARLSAAPDRMCDVEDVSQAALTGLTTALSRLENRTVGGLKAYVSGIVAHKVSDFLRTKPAERRGRPGVSLDSTVAGFSSPGPLWQFLSASGTSPLSAADRTDQIMRLMEELGQLKPEHREVITLAFFDQLPTSEVAANLRVSRPAAAMLLLRAVKALRRRMTGSSELH